MTSNKQPANLPIGIGDRNQHVRVESIVKPEVSCQVWPIGVVAGWNPMSAFQEKGSEWIVRSRTSS
jgi:hypothetical protein